MAAEVAVVEPLAGGATATAVAAMALAAMVMEAVAAPGLAATVMGQAEVPSVGMGWGQHCIRPSHRW